MIEDDTWYRCNICGREGRVGRCCSDEDRTPLNALAKAEQERIKGAKKHRQRAKFLAQITGGRHGKNGNWL